MQLPLMQKVAKKMTEALHLSKRLHLLLRFLALVVVHPQREE
jgi:hypothetical protein